MDEDIMNCASANEQQDLMENNSIEFDSPKEQSSYIKVIGVGGGGGNAVNYMSRKGINGVDFIVCNTDAKAINASPVANKIRLGNGLGAGNKPARAQRAAQEKAEEIKKMLSHDTQMLFITAGMGGGTGTGASPVIAEIAKSIELDNEDTKKILVVAIVTTPFQYEGTRRLQQAMQGIEELRKHVDSILIINNDKLRTFGNLALEDAFDKSNDVLYTAANSISGLITGNGIINLDFEDVNTVMENSGTALMGSGSGKGKDRAITAIKDASTSVLLNDNDISGAKDILLYYSYPESNRLTMDEMSEISNYIEELTHHSGANLIWGAGVDNTLEDELRITLIATGFETKEQEERGTFTTLEEDKEGKTDTTITTAQEKHLEPIKKEVPDTAAPPVPEPISVNTSARNTDYFPPANTPKTDNDKTPEGKRYVLDDKSNEEATNAKKIDTTPNDGIEKYIGHIEGTKQIDPITNTRPAPIETPQQTNPFTSKERKTDFYDINKDDLVSKVMDRTERIRKMNELLHNGGTEGVTKIENMTVDQLINDPFVATPSSRERLAPETFVNPDGTIVKNTVYLEDNPD